jgi:hypothetical protein
LIEAKIVKREEITKQASRIKEICLFLGNKKRSRSTQSILGADFNTASSGS